MGELLGSRKEKDQGAPHRRRRAATAGWTGGGKVVAGEAVGGASGVA
jgi:hypothetical protein